jgi:hypothetical protein
MADAHTALWGVQRLSRFERLIHPSAWNKNSANFAFWGFSEVRIHGVLRSSRGPVLPTRARCPAEGDVAAFAFWAFSEIRLKEILVS